MATQRVVVIGAGIGGLVAALELARHGVDVTVVERAAAVGGKMREVVVDGAPIDAGPTVLTMRPVFEAIFAEAGTNLSAMLTLRPLEVLARHAWDAGGRLDLFADIDRAADAIAAFATPAEGRRYRAFCERARRIFRTLDRPFIRSPEPSMAGLMRGAGLGDLWGIQPFGSMWRALGEFFHDPRLRQLFARYATYCGSSPFLAPATLMLVAHVEQEGVWLVEGGMHALAKALRHLAEAKGVSFRLGCEVSGIDVQGGQVCGVRLADGTALPADAVVSNADTAALAGGRFGAAASHAVPPTAPEARSLSAVTWALRAEATGFPLLRHTVFFSDAYEAEFDDILRRRRLPLAPTVYVCAQDRGDANEPEPPGPERLFCLVNAPPIGDSHPFEPTEIAACEQRTFALLARCGLSLEARRAPVATTPRDFDRLFPGTGGALYGPASHGWRASFQRPGIRSRLPGLYLAGGSVHPGPGVPMAALSGRMAAACLLADFASTRRSSRTAMFGGTSMR